MEGDCSRVLVDMESGPVYPSTTVTLVREKPTQTHRWRLSGALLAMALCEYNDSGKYKNTVEWTDKVGQGFSQGGLELDNNEIVIPQDGLYFVYNQASFHVSCKADPKHPNDQEMVHLSNTVKRWSLSYGSEDNKKYQTLLNSVRTVCKKSSNSEAASEGKWYNAVYVGAVFRLERGDRLQTVIEKRLLPHLGSGDGKNFFGVFAL
ncbi:unnamed protein product [Coregonus sp. 'balchen']|nr:unnamed protein product [Coregonus sp. 'balchen']